MTYVTHLECGMCGKSLDAGKTWNLCPSCNKPLLVRYDLDAAQKAINPGIIALRAPNLWRYRELLPITDPANILTLGEGFTPLHHAQRLGCHLGFDRLYIKDEGLNPTGSFKARGMSAAVSRAKELGITSLSVPSAGNAGGAMSAYAALAGMEAHVYMPRDVPKTFIDECLALGALINLVDGLITDCGKAAADDVKYFHRFDMSTLKEPYRIEGKKTMGYELAEQMNWKLPDVVIYPTGGGTGLVGMWKAFDEMEKLGWIDSRRPRMVTVQSDGCAPLVKAFNEGQEFAAAWSDAKTIAHGLRVPAAVGDFLILRALRESQGTALAVPDNEIIMGTCLMGKCQGIYPAPEGGATVAAFMQLRKQGWIQDHETVVLFNTGCGYKYDFPVDLRKQKRKGKR